MRTLKECDALQHISNSEEVKNVNRQLLKAIKFTIWNNRQGIYRYADLNDQEQKVQY